MLQIAEALGEERTQMKLSDAKHQLEEKNVAVESFLKENGCGSIYQRRDGDLAFCPSDNTSNDDGENSIELKNNYKMSSASMTPRNVERHSVDEQLKGRKSLFNQVARRSTSLLRSVSNIVEWGNEKQILGQVVGMSYKGIKVTEIIFFLLQVMKMRVHLASRAHDGHHVNHAVLHCRDQ